MSGTSNRADYRLDFAGWVKKRRRNIAGKEQTETLPVATPTREPIADAISTLRSQDRPKADPILSWGNEQGDGSVDYERLVQDSADLMSRIRIGQKRFDLEPRSVGYGLQQSVGHQLTEQKLDASLDIDTMGELAVVTAVRDKQAYKQPVRGERDELHQHERVQISEAPNGETSRTDHMPSLQSSGATDSLFYRCHVCGETFIKFSIFNGHACSQTPLEVFPLSSLSGPHEPMSFRKRQLDQTMSNIAVEEPLDVPPQQRHGDTDEHLQLLRATYDLLSEEAQRSREALKENVDTPSGLVSNGKIAEPTQIARLRLRVRQDLARKLYMPLLPWETRLIVIHPGSTGEPLSTELLTGILTDDATGLGCASEKRLVDFEALSYTWGELVFTHSLNCNSQEVPITRNLDEALRHLRLLDKHRYIWVDQLCINQSDTLEKATQISKLFQIFQRASRVTVWLGQGNETVRLAIQSVKDTARNAEATSIGEQFNKTVTPSHLGNESDRNDEWLTGLIHLFRLPWFRRAWCVQEIFAARMITLHYGAVEISWNDLLLAKQSLAQPAMLTRHLRESDRLSELSYYDGCLLSKIEELLPNLAGIIAVTLMEDLRVQAQGTLTWAALDQSALSYLHDTLARSNHLMATDDRDHIFALLGIATELYKRYHNVRSSRLVPGLLPVDYEQGTSDLYQEVTKRMINEFRTLEAIYGKDFDLGSSSSNASNPVEDLPSWTPDWRNYHNFLSPFLGPQYRRSAQQPMRQYEQFILQHLHARGILKITGIIIGQVTCGDRLGGRSPWGMLSPKDAEAAIIDVNEQAHWGWTVEHSRSFESTKLRATPGSALRYLHSPAGSSQWRGIGQPTAGDVLVVVFGGLTPLVLRRTDPNSDFYKLIGHACVFQKASRLQASAVLEERWLGSSLEARLGEILQDSEGQSPHALHLEAFELI